MISKKLIPLRYQLNKDASIVVSKKHPWIFRTHLSSASNVFKDGQWLRLVNSNNEILGYGVYAEEGIIGIRVFKYGKTPPDKLWFLSQLDKAILKREQLRKYSEAYRALHGENDSFPGIVVDIYKDLAVLQTYSSSIDSIGRWLASRLSEKLSVRCIVWKLPAKRKRSEKEMRFLKGAQSSPIIFSEGKMKITVDVISGQKSGAFLDLRGLRKYLASQNYNGKRVLNLFSYTGTLSLACEVGGATEVLNVDISKEALKAAEKFHTLNSKKIKFIEADVFKWVESLPPHERYDVVIVDPPLMASSTTQVEKALGVYKSIYKRLLPHLNANGVMIVCCCTSRISRKKFEDNANRVLNSSCKFIKSLPHEDDHPVGFPEGDYLKVMIYSKR